MTDENLAGAVGTANDAEVSAQSNVTLSDDEQRKAEADEKGKATALADAQANVASAEKQVEKANAQVEAAQANLAQAQAELDALTN